MGQVTRDQVLGFLGCRTDSKIITTRTQTTTYSTYKVYPLVLGRPAEGKATETIQCQVCGKDVKLTVQSEYDRRLTLCLYAAVALVPGIAISVVSIVTPLHGVCLIGTLAIAYGAYCLYEAFLKKAKPTDVLQLLQDQPSHKLYDEQPRSLPF